MSEVSTVRWLVEEALKCGCPRDELATALLMDRPDLSAVILAAVDEVYPPDQIDTARPA
jgi:hypothetical protein